MCLSGGAVWKAMNPLGGSLAGEEWVLRSNHSAALPSLFFMKMGLMWLGASCSCSHALLAMMYLTLSHRLTNLFFSPHPLLVASCQVFCQGNEEVTNTRSYHLQHYGARVQEKAKNKTKQKVWGGAKYKMGKYEIWNMWPCKIQETFSDELYLPKLNMKNQLALPMRE